MCMCACAFNSSNYLYAEPKRSSLNSDENEEERKKRQTTQEYKKSVTAIFSIF